MTQRPTITLLRRADRAVRSAKRDRALVDVATARLRWPLWPEAMEADVVQSLEAHECVAVGLADLLAAARRG
jgi:hypothetical protein